jgi:proline racemase
VLAAKPTRPRRKKISGCKWCANVSLQSSVRCAVAYEETDEDKSPGVVGIR